MNRRIVALVAVPLAVLALVRFTATAQEGRRRAAQDHAAAAEQLETCAKACSDCQRMCDMCGMHCAHLLHAGQAEHMTTLATCQDCADICAAASQVVARGGPFAAVITQACEEACARCAEECEKFPDDEHMKRCAQECRKCEKACQEMLAHLGHSDRAGDKAGN